MKGILEKEMPEAGQVQDKAGPGGGETQQDPGMPPPPEVLQQMGMTPEQMPALNEYLANGMKLIHSTKTRDVVLDTLGKVGLAQTLIPIIEKLDQSASASGRDMPDMVRFIAGFALLNQLAEIGMAAKVGQYGEQELMQAFSEVMADQVDKGIKSGKYDPQEMLKVAEDAANKTGLGQKMQGQPGQQQPAQPQQPGGIIAGAQR